ncbi:MAG: carboxypeptidase regulatory-like domain-containing protein [Planctomycetes bacterium]|nr:carboxypeptidase regulatory-like domain-containing protein [Planctomycetota bacterium]
MAKTIVLFLVIVFCYTVCSCTRYITVKDTKGNPVADADVYVVRFSLSADAVRKTSSNGHVSFPAIPSLEFIRIIKPGFLDFHCFGPDVHNVIIMKENDD